MNELDFSQLLTKGSPDALVQVNSMGQLKAFDANCILS
jgi:hypothetical protein